MGRIMGIDYGRKRTGVAVTDPLGIVAGNLATVPTHTLMQFIIDYIAREQVERIVVGQPTQLNGEPSESMKYITPFVNRLRKQLPDAIPVVMYDERFTSTIAHQAMIDGGMKKSDRRDKSRVDAIAATIILNDYLQSIYNQPDIKAL
ncbi:MAG: Holliday junction resolvase RuvX [Muribaculaceae bacterium]|nr:Holliday junction resolvase RuvX [Muribaculaceae bacterium]